MPASVAQARADRQALAGSAQASAATVRRRWLERRPMIKPRTPRPNRAKSAGSGTSVPPEELVVPPDVVLLLVVDDEPVDPPLVDDVAPPVEPPLVEVVVLVVDPPKEDEEPPDVVEVVVVPPEVVLLPLLLVTPPDVEPPDVEPPEVVDVVVVPPEVVLLVTPPDVDPPDVVELLLVVVEPPDVEAPDEVLLDVVPPPDVEDEPVDEDVPWQPPACLWFFFDHQFPLLPDPYVALAGVAIAIAKVDASTSFKVLLIIYFPAYFTRRMNDAAIAGVNANALPTDEGYAFPGL
jgi:hypothetical protein